MPLERGARATELQRFVALVEVALETVLSLPANGRDKLQCLIYMFDFCYEFTSETLKCLY